jgi:hypothetical protein
LGGFKSRRGISDYPVLSHFGEEKTEAGEGWEREASEVCVPAFLPLILSCHHEPSSHLKLTPHFPQTAE